MTAYMTLTLEKTVDLNVYGKIITLPLSYAEGMIGACAVFSTREEAESYTDGNSDVLVITLGEEQIND